ncbi:MAG: BON domain-containing protein [Gemmatimonadaceae bacterium]|nr:BON domain-containing protein [Gemmatimonadaceae bacterium]
MRVIEVEEERNGTAWLWWMVAGTALGVGAGILLSEKFSGRRTGARSLLRRARTMAKTAAAQWGPLVDLALELREAWAEGREEAELELPAAAYDDADEYDEDYEEEELEDDEDLDDDDDEDEDLDDLDDEDSDDEDEEEDLDDEDFEDEEEDDDLDDDDDLDADADDDADEDEEPVSEIGSRVLEAFVNDPVLVERDVEIEADENGAVLLHGAVRASKEIPHAVTIAKGVPGVTSVRQRLKVSRK